MKCIINCLIPIENGIENIFYIIKIFVFQRLSRLNITSTDRSTYAGINFF
jgi:hypothetical protein